MLVSVLQAGLKNQDSSWRQVASLDGVAEVRVQPLGHGGCVFIDVGPSSR